MKVGDTVKFSFAKKEKQGVIVELHEKSVRVKVDFPKQKNKLVLRKRSELKSA